MMKDNVELTGVDLYRSFDFEFSELQTDITEIEKFLGDSEGADRELVRYMIEDILKEAAQKSKIKGEYRIFNNVRFNPDGNSIAVNNVDFEVKKIVYNELRNSESIAVFVCTAGEEIGFISKNAMKQGDVLKGFIADVAGSHIVDSASEFLQRKLEKALIHSGKKITNRYSPGYCDWNVDEQHKLFKLLPENYAGIKLTHSALMEPIKSISGFIGIGENVRYNLYTCSFCDRIDCIARRAG
jgi:hypothetical protein